MHRSATANPRIEGTAVIQRHLAAPGVSTRNPSHDGSSQNQSAKNPVPTASEANTAGHRPPSPGPSATPAPLVIGRALSITAEYHPCGSTPAINGIPLVTTASEIPWNKR